MKKRHCLLICLLILGPASLSGAATFNVSNLPQLQNALTSAETNNESDVIIVDAGIYNISAILYYFPQDPENYNLYVRGAGIGKTIFDGGGIAKFLDVDTRALADDSNGHFTIEGVTFQNAISGPTTGGGAMVVATNNANVTILSSQFSNNTSQYDAGGLFVRTDASGNINVINNVFSDNSATSIGGGADLRVSADAIEGTAGIVHLINNTFVGNSAGHVAGGVRILLSNLGDTANIYNNIVWNNSGQLASDLIVSNPTGAKVNLFNNIYGEFSVSISGNLSQGNNVNQAPLLTADFHLQSDSPGVNAGSDSAPLLPATDFEGDPRIIGPAPDIGADEFAEPGIYPEEGTVGTEVTILGSNFGTKKGKVLLETTSLKIIEWTNESIRCFLSKALPPGPYDVTMQPNKADPIVLAGAFTVVVPEIDTIEPASGSAEEEITIRGSFFGTKKGKVAIGGKNCRVLNWAMSPSNGESEILIQVSKGLAPGTYDLTVSNQVGAHTMEEGFTIP